MFCPFIDEVCFQKDGLLHDEFEQVFPALFGRSKNHEKLIRQIAKKRYGISRGDLIKATKIKSGAVLNRPLEELEAAGFIAKFVPYGKNVREQYFKVIDEYTNFYLTWISGVRRKGLKAKRDY